MREYSMREDRDCGIENDQDKSCANEAHGGHITHKPAGATYSNTCTETYGKAEDSNRNRFKNAANKNGEAICQRPEEASEKITFTYWEVGDCDAQYDRKDNQGQKSAVLSGLEDV